MKTKTDIECELSRLYEESYRKDNTDEHQKRLETAIIVLKWVLD